ncbi:MAG: BamA/TamA family outer membrane protein, partial [bacterium]
RKDFFDFKRLSFGAEYSRKLATTDQWRIGDVENSLAAFFFRDDHRDYFGKQGITFYVDHKFLETHILRLEVGRHTYDAVERNIDWSVFGGNFAENPRRADSIIPGGDETSLRFIAAFDWRDNPIFPISGWLVEAIYEKTFDDFDTDGLFLTIHRFQQTFGNHRLFIRGMVGTRRGDIGLRAGNLSPGVPDTLFQQYSLDLGGFGSLRGFDEKEFTGNRMVMLNFNYLFGGDILQQVPLQRIPFFGALWSALSLGVFVDTGWAWTTSDLDDGLLSGFDDLDLKTDVGLSLLALEGVLRLDIAKRTDRSNDDFRVTFRLLKTF